MEGQEGRDKEDNAHDVVVGYTGPDNEEDMLVDSRTARGRLPLRHEGRHVDHNKEAEAGKCLGRKSNDWGCDYSLLAVLEELHNLRLTCEMEGNVENGLGKASPEEAVETVCQFRRNLVLLPHVVVAFPYLGVHASSILSNAAAHSRSIRGSTR